MICIDRLRLHNFRCFEDCEVSFEPDLTVFVSRNGQGKTAILDAIALTLGLFVDAISGLRSRRGLRHKDIRRVAGEERSDMAERFVICSAQADVGKHKIMWSRVLGANARSERISEKEAGPLLNVGKAIHSRLAQRDSADDLAIPFVGYYGTGRRWQTADEKPAAYALKVVNERFLGYSDCLSGAASYGLFVDWYERTFISLSKHIVTGTKKANRPEFLLNAVNHAMESVIEPETGWSGLRWDGDERQLLLTHLVHGPLPLDFLSDGIRNTAALVADVAHRCARLNPQLDDPAKETAGILIIDEVDLHLHPEWQQRIVEMLRAAFPKMQLILSTHSPQVLSTVNANQIRVVRFREALLEIRKPAFQTRGVESADVLANIMGVDPVPRVAEARWLSDYRAAIEQGDHEEPEGLKLRAQLIGHFSDQHPVMLECDRLIRFTRFKRMRGAEGTSDAST